MLSINDSTLCKRESAFSMDKNLLLVWETSYIEMGANREGVGKMYDSQKPA